MSRSKNNNYGLIALAGGVVAGGVAIVSAIPRLKRRALRATTILRKDHRLVSGLFWTLQQTTVPAVRKSIFSQIQDLVEIHSAVEEEIFYPTVSNLYTANAQAQVEESKLEHRQIRKLCDAVASTDPNSFMFMSKVNELKETIEHHVEEEENEMFPLIERTLSNDELYRLGSRMHDLKLRIKDQERIAA
jgi:hemerythrin superfamily protein